MTTSAILQDRPPQAPPPVSPPRAASRESQITEDVRALASFDLEALRAEWRQRWGDAPCLRSPDLLRRMIAWRIQAAAFGDLDADTRRGLRRTSASTTPAMKLTPGTRLAREWRGAVCEVEVVDGGFDYQGQTYGSLSKIAGVITGVKWNGPRFFGLVRKEAA